MLTESGHEILDSDPLKVVGVSLVSGARHQGVIPIVGLQLRPYPLFLCTFLLLLKIWCDPLMSTKEKHKSEYPWSCYRRNEQCKQNLSSVSKSCNEGPHVQGPQGGGAPIHAPFKVHQFQYFDMSPCIRVKRRGRLYHSQYMFEWLHFDEFIFMGEMVV
ncbi:hypothetical protein VNO77_19504 [Canavalia gladiata]|uniref:Uncharacterized protein n=1 Tax=Canavalia gladiata TaxID=3824 RepID=A0AAN9QIJ9_CANGL